MGWFFLRWRWLVFAAAVTAAVAVALYPSPVCACVEPQAILAAFADIAPERAGDAPAEELALGLNKRLAAWTYTYAMLPPDLRSFCTPDALDHVNCRLVTREAPLRELGLELTFTEDAQGFLAHVEVRPFSRWRMGPEGWPREGWPREGWPREGWPREGWPREGW